MAGFVQNIIWNSVGGFVEAGKRSAGEFAGNALIKTGDLVENAGRSVGTGIEKKATSYGSTLSGQTHTPAPKALPSTARKPVVKRSNSLPASTSRPTASKTVGPTSKTPMGANKYPGANQVNGTTKRVTNGVAGARNTVGGVTNGATKTLGGVTNGATKTVGGVTNGATRTLGGVTNGATRTLGGVTNGATKSLGGVTNGVTKGLGGVTNGATKSLGGGLKPYSSNNASSYNSPFPSAKTPVKPGQPKPFAAPAEAKPTTPYPGTNTLPGQANKTPVRPQRYNPVPRLGPQVKQGQKANHLAL